jgi:transposase
MSCAPTNLPENIADLKAAFAELQADFLRMAERNEQLVGDKTFLLSQLSVQKDKLASQDLQIQTVQDKLAASTMHIKHLEAQLDVLKRSRFGRSSEKLERQIEQIELQLEDHYETAGQQSAEEQKTYPLPASTKPRGKPVRKPLPDHLPRERVEYPAACSCPTCGGTRLTCIGTDEREVLERVPATLKVVVHVRPKMACRDCEAINQAPLPSLPIVRGIPGPGLLASVLIHKFDDHLPLYRQSEIFAREGVEIDTSTLGDWVGTMSSLLTPLADAVAAYVRQGQVVHADDTVLPVLSPGHGKVRKGRLWVALRDERNWGSSSPPAVYYLYAPDRKKIQADELLGDFTGYLQADAYSGFKHLYIPDPKTGAPARMTEVACWAHARRKIYDEHIRGASPSATELMTKIAELFAIEADLKGRPAAERLQARMEKAVPRLENIRLLMDRALMTVSGKLTYAEALSYVLTRWDSFTRYTTDGRLEIDNNAAERMIKPAVMGRKNYMFAGSDKGGTRAAVAYTLIESAKLNGLNPETYLRDVIARIGDHPIKQISELLPWNFKA